MKKYQLDEKQVKFDFIVNENKRTTQNDVSICLFCDKINDNIQQNLKHMEINHGFFICEEKYIKDLEGLILFLAKQINEQLVCIFCEYHESRPFPDAESVKKHMIDKGHCFMNNELFFQLYCDFYDFTSAIKGIIEQNKQELYLKYKQSQIAQGVVLNELGEAELPNGKIIGHRSLAVQYNQYYRPMASQESKIKALVGEDQYKQNQEQIIKYEKELVNFYFQLFNIFVIQIIEKQKDLKESKNYYFQDYKHINNLRYNNLKLGLETNKVQNSHVYQGKL
ncbi:zinc c2h2 type family protein, putative [Ichthyophthirius multifiliis]|uniref:Zinc c2h2 type family protein, putative n=1 Tax=Ichthyophthirius multifiliis TaxID=5932 RepID=G0QU35_ICHMU|nr:zinc c2h2 type family protein, putative [Ichthyophthirius multifiliis]EGR31259.1 zinc c2h2 type family protein, putative [Ichthyophthirius multifiliis]|eukprot:XP_004034745.1 zinc c2h2 type family protein, putative [Ichthyophthirius multifiliis]